MNVPAIFLSILISTVCGLLFHIIRGGSSARLGLYVLTAWIAFLAGHLVGQWLDWSFIRLGTINLFPALVPTILGLIAASILAGPEQSPAPKRKKRR